ncbi:hypothetical protein [Micromonospora sp. URMC 103]|uniref:hypothetical protein n=1 Tax=Micromonospora sp. URMC 103 TaxID=3423406 RepID=UPI003F1D99A1
MIMAVRGHVKRLATVFAVLGGLVLLGASPAMADDDSVRLRSADSFTAGGSAEGVNLEVRKRSDGCVMLRTALGLRLEGLEASQVTVQVNYGGRWFPVPLGGGSGHVTTSQTSPAKPTLCKGKGVTVRYRISFERGAPNGRLSVTGEASNAVGQALGRDAESARVVGGRATASPTPSKKPSPSPTPEATEAPSDAGTTPAALAVPTGGPSTRAAEESSGLSPVMFVGLGLVVAGALLIVLLVRRSRQDRAPADEPVLPLAGSPGGTTYRSGGGVPAAPGQPGQVYGQQPAAGGVYGVPSSRPAGGVYGSRPAAEPDTTRPISAPGETWSPAEGDAALPSPTPDATRPLPGHAGGRIPSQPGTVPPQVPGPVADAPGEPPASAGDGDHTVYMPRLPG